MANVIIKADDRRRDEAFIRRSFHVGNGDAAGCEAAECIAAKSREAERELRKMEDKHR